MADRLERLTLLARRQAFKLQVGVLKRHGLDQRRLSAFLGGREPLTPSPLAPRPTYAVVVPCYDHAGYLPHAFHSIEAQTLPPDQVVLVDDRSGDDTWRLLGELRAASPLGDRVDVFRNERNLGQCATLNAAVSHTSADVIVVLNDDDYLMHDALEWIDKTFHQHPEAGLVGAKSISVRSQVYLDNLKKTVTGSLISDEFALNVSSPQAARQFTHARQLVMCHSASAFRREAWQAAGGYYADKAKRIVIYSDRDFQLRVNCLYPVVVVENAAFAFWRAGSSVDGGLFT